MLKITKFRKRWTKQLNKLQQEQWGEDSDSDDICTHTDDYKIRVIVKHNRIRGAMVWHIEDDVCFIDFIILKPEVQHAGYGNRFMKYLIQWCERHNYHTIQCDAIDVCGKINALNLLNKYNFSELYKIDNYWGNLFPNFNCKECGHKPCICTLHRFEKKI